MGSKEPESKAALIRDELAKGLSAVDIAKKHGYRQRYVFSVQQRMRLDSNGQKSANVAKCAVKTVPIDALIEQERLDPRRILRDGLRTINEGEVAMDETLRRDLQLSTEVWRRVSRDEEFLPYRALLPSRRAVWGRPKTIAALKEQDGVT